MKNFLRTLREMARYPSAIIGMTVVFLLVAFAIYVVIAIPYRTAIDLWRGGEEAWYQNPKFAPPEWMNWFTEEKAPVSFVINEETGGLEKVQDGDTITLTYTFDFTADTFPQEMILYFKSDFENKSPFVSVKLLTPDGREIRIGSFGVSETQTYRLSQDEKLKLRLSGQEPMTGLFSLVDENGVAVPVKGTYKLVVEASIFEEGSDVNAEFVFHGQVYGLAGTDHQRRDLTLPLQWGVPVALAFGLLAAVGTTVLTMVIAAIGTWYGGWVDGMIQRITEVNMVLPFLSILIMVGTFYSRSLWVILSVTILLSIFTGGIKGFRAVFLQVKESTYIEAARAYGASNNRIIFLYLIPRMIPLLIPGLVSAVPGFVFLEATLAVLGLGDPVLPTWGKVINDAWVNGALYKGLYYWIMEPAIVLMVTGLGFALLGYSLDKIFNPRLRGQ